MSGLHPDFVFRVFRSELNYQCSRGLIAWEQMQTALESDQMDLFWYHANVFLNSAANVSKMLWPSRKSQSRFRGLPLRRHLGISEESALKGRRLRDHFEHFEERLEDWASRSKLGMFIDRIIVDSGPIVGVEPHEIMRMYDRPRSTMHFRGESFELLPLLEALKETLSRVEQADLGKPRSRPTD